MMVQEPGQGRGPGSWRLEQIRKTLREMGSIALAWDVVQVELELLETALMLVGIEVQGTPLPLFP